jgi:NhaA family Na+:H+ antiporter
MPIFALANAGIVIGDGFFDALLRPVTIGVVVGLFVGKQIGITLFSWLAVRTRIAALPAGTTMKQIYGAAMLGGIGFTMSIFIASLAFDDPAHLNDAKIGILIASFISAVAGWIVLIFATRTETTLQNGDRTP